MKCTHDFANGKALTCPLGLSSGSTSPVSLDCTSAACSAEACECWNGRLSSRPGRYGATAAGPCCAMARKMGFWFPLRGFFFSSRFGSIQFFALPSYRSFDLVRESQNRRCAKNESVNLDIPRWGSLKIAAKVEWTREKAQRSVRNSYSPRACRKGRKKE